jgi:hypothetical protein
MPYNIITDPNATAATTLEQWKKQYKDRNVEILHDQTTVGFHVVYQSRKVEHNKPTHYQIEQYGKDFKSSRKKQLQNQS